MKRLITGLFLTGIIGIAYYQIDRYYEEKIYKEVSIAMRACEAALESKASIEISGSNKNRLLAEKAVIEAPGLKVVIDKEDNWQTVAMLVVTLLASYLGIKVINRIFSNGV